MANGTSDLSAQGSSQLRTLALTAQIVSAYLAHNPVALPELPGLIHKVHVSLVQAGGAQASLRPAVPINRSVFPDYIVCLENGRRLRTLRRHLMAAFGLTPEAYRRRWGLPHNYPMIAPNYARARSGVAKATGLGRRTPAAPGRSRRVSEQST